MSLPAPPFDAPFSDANGNISRAWAGWIGRAFIVLFADQQSGTTAQRPTDELYVGRPYLDTTIGKPIWYSGSGWIKADGTAA